MLVDYLVTQDDICLHTYISRHSDGLHFQVTFKLCIITYFIMLDGYPYIISRVVLYKL